MTNWSEKVAIITGGARGMGAAHVRELAHKGASVVFTDILEADGQALAQSLGGNVTFLKHDVADAKQWEQVVQHVEQQYGPVNILINNAGISIKGSIEQLSEADYRKVLDVNQIGVLHGLKAVLPSMKRAGSGSIINISSILGLAARAESVAYVSTKFAITGMTKVAALEYAEHRIRVNSIHPGSIRTALTDTVYPTEEALKARERAIPLQRFGSIEDVAQLASYLASDESLYMTGSEFVIDGGLLARI